MHPDEDFQVDRELPPQSDDLVEDLGLSTLFAAMAGGDNIVLAAAKTAVLSPLAGLDAIIWRQQAFADCSAHPQLPKKLYSLATDAIEGHKKSTFWGVNRSPESLRYVSVQTLEMFLGHLANLRRLAEAHGPEMASPAFSRLASMLLSELDDAYLGLVRSHLSELKLTGGLTMSAQLGRASKGTAYALHRTPTRGFRERLANRGDASFSFTVAGHDDNEMRALAELVGKGTNIAAGAVAQSVEPTGGAVGQRRADLHAGPPTGAAARA
jgi:hypothetical protein